MKEFLIELTVAVGIIVVLGGLNAPQTRVEHAAVAAVPEADAAILGADTAEVIEPAEPEGLILPLPRPQRG